MKATDSLLFLNINPDNSVGYGAPCSGDSGSPVFGAAGVVVSVFSFSAGNCQNKGGGPRLDRGPGRDFLKLRGLVP